MAWLRLGEVAVNPFGDDDDDFDIIGVFDNHVQVMCVNLSLEDTIFYLKPINFFFLINSLN